MSDTPEVVTIQPQIGNISIPLNVSQADIPYIEEAVNEINQALTNVSRGKKFQLNNSPANQYFIFAMIQLVYAKNRQTQGISQTEIQAKLDDLVSLCDKTLRKHGP